MSTVHLSSHIFPSPTKSPSPDIILKSLYVVCQWPASTRPQNQDWWEELSPTFKLRTNALHIYILLLLLAVGVSWRSSNRWTVRVVLLAPSNS